MLKFGEKKRPRERAKPKHYDIVKGITIGDDSDDELINEYLDQIDPVAHTNAKRFKFND